MLLIFIIILTKSPRRKGKERKGKERIGKDREGKGRKGREGVLLEFRNFVD